MQEIHFILVNSTKLFLICQTKSENFPVNLSKPTIILYGSSADGLLLKQMLHILTSTLKNYRIFYPLENNFKS